MAPPVVGYTPLQPAALASHSRQDTAFTGRTAMTFFVKAAGTRVM
ncbi:hypothetical protein [Burkholderia cenocepacia]|nr:hypothetical protein [Burkholderia cenocepacia]